MGQFTNKKSIRTKTMKYIFRFLVLVVVAFTFHVESFRYLIVKDNKKSPKIPGFRHAVQPLTARAVPRCPAKKIVKPCTLKKTPNECDEWVDISGSDPPQRLNICKCIPHKIPGKKKPVGRCANNGGN